MPRTQRGSNHGGLYTSLTLASRRGTSRGVYDDARSLRADYDETREVSPKRDASFSLEISRQRSAPGRRRITTTRQGSQRRSAPGRRQTTTRSVGGRIGKPWYTANGVAAGLLSATKRGSREPSGEWEWVRPGFLERGSEASQASVKGRIKDVT